MKRALVLGGGGSKGAYEIGAWKAMDELGITFNIVIGTSIGALIGMLYIQHDFRKAYRIWSKLCIDDVIQDGINLDFNLSHLYQQKKQVRKFLKNMIMYQGMDITPLNNLVLNMFDEQKFFASPIDYACTAVSLTEHKPKVFYKKMMTKENATECVLASAACFPAFPLKKIDNSYYIDGGYYDNVPITLARSMGANEIVAIDLKSIGRKKLHEPQKDTLYIEPYVSLGNFLMFDNIQIHRNIQLGYQDTLKKYKAYLGTIYTFHRNEKNQIQELEMLLKQNISRLFAIRPNSNNIVFTNRIIIQRMRKYIQTYDGYDYPYIMLLEKAAFVLGVDDLGVYTRTSFVKYIKQCIQYNIMDMRSGVMSVKKDRESICKIYYQLKKHRSISHSFCRESSANLFMGCIVYCCK